MSSVDNNQCVYNTDKQISFAKVVHQDVVILPSSFESHAAESMSNILSLEKLDLKLTRHSDLVGMLSTDLTTRYAHRQLRPTHNTVVECAVHISRCSGIDWIGEQSSAEMFRFGVHYSAAWGQSRRSQPHASCTRPAIHTP